MRISHAVSAVSMVLFLAGCNDTGGSVCKADVEVEVYQTSAVPEIDWSPNCVMTGLTVTRVGGTTEETMWSVTAPELSPFAPAVTYGVTPEGATATAVPKALVAGVSYRATVVYRNDAGEVLGTGVRVFTK